ncbi:MAG: hypothetical protein A2Y03_07525 [Omnitrophica WOR_2 bacterium GWF2_38_59]|nr:MAG: hypothetical protein A2Y03_07525 [Omnitrophica WOR_2 bacterium GWF2_38_59]OGX48810.1 MAG: hypothetical protein A2243_09005 [Omnitrophica WOR_2 bacterium RIFOXYA2_FULL_38_17]OGX56627.1 MAG: hypothetical protein A2306_04085 [Omnitrophica WOR_2 bacterium RIFOXYB2_FULL_38_16]HBG60846.1 hypothetical protein [Candidatus Omnitrophota bacterium]
MDNELLIKAFEAAQKGRSFAFATVVETTGKGTPRKTGAKMIVLEDGSLFGTIGGGSNEKKAREECLKAIKQKRSTLFTYDLLGKKGQPICGGQIKVFIEPFTKKNKLVICGGGHIALPLSAIGKMLNFEVSVIDARKEFSRKKRFPHIDKVIFSDQAKYLAKLPIDQNTFIIIVTHGHEFDYDCLKAVVRSNAAYIGVISSKLKRTKFLAQLKKEGVDQKYLKKIKIPVGIDIGAQTPEEIAISIAAEIISVTNKDSIGTAKFKRNP